MFEGTYTALVTPFRNDQVDEEALRALVREQVEAGVDGVVPCGSTGESATLSHTEHETVIALTIEEAAGRIKVIAGTGSNNTAEAVRLTRYAAEAGADGALLISPYYNKPTQEGLYRHYMAVADGTDLPLILYNIPGRTAVSIEPATLGRLSHAANIVGLKEASGSLDVAMRMLQAAGDDFTLLSGDDTLTLPLMAIGGRGVIAVTSNLLPKRMAAMVKAAAGGDFKMALEIHRQLLPVMQAMGLVTNPIPVKTAMALTGKIAADVRLPLTPMDDSAKHTLENVLRGAGLIGR